MNLLVTTPTNIRYLTGFVGVETRDAYVLLTKNKTYFFTNSLYMEQAKKLSPIQISKEYPVTKALKDLHITSLEFEEHNLTVAELKTFGDFTMIPTQGRIEKLRQIKKPEEIKNIKKACRITKKCFAHLQLVPGVTENEIAWEIETFFRKNNAGTAFSPIVAFGAHSSMPHYQSGNTKLQHHDLVLLDFGAKYNGYSSDMTRVVFIGTPRPEWVHAYQTVLQAQQQAIAAISSGKNLDSIAKKVIVDAGLPPYQHGLGHQIGLDVHEGKIDTLLPGMVFSVEPGTYIEGKYGIRIEDLILLKTDGIEVLT